MPNGDTAAASAEEQKILAGDNNSEEKESKENPSSKDITFEKMVAIDNDECSITINEIDESDVFGFFNLKASFDNKSAEKTYMFSVETAYINGVKADPLFATEVNPGKKANEDISFNRSVLEENGIVDFTDIEITFEVYNTDDYEDHVAKETIHIYPYGEENASKFTREAADTDTVLADDENVTIILTKKKKDDEWEYYLAQVIWQIRSSPQNWMPANVSLQACPGLIPRLKRMELKTLRRLKLILLFTNPMNTKTVISMKNIH